MQAGHPRTQIFKEELTMAAKKKAAKKKKK
jgi:hypothetical protein